MKFLVHLLLFTVFLSKLSFGQVIPDSNRVDWSKAGYEGTIPKPSNIINVKSFGAIGDSLNDDYSAIMDAINSASGLRVIFFPAGKYLIKSPITLPDNVVLRGEGENTNLYFKLTSGAHAIKVTAAQTNPFTRVTSGFTKGSTTLTLASTTGFNANDIVEIREQNGAFDTKPASYAKYNVGQIVKITSVSGNTVTIEPALRITYIDSLTPEIRPVTMRENIGIECLRLHRLDSTISSYGYNIFFSFARNCWVTGVESNKSQGAHILLASASHITVSGCYFHDAYTYDGTGTAGYGAAMIEHTSDCKVENSIFKHLRHSMIAKQGANGNVFAYNYSIEPFRSETPSDAGGDMLLHGHYAFANLFEGNIGQTISIDATWGPSGPYNTFFRNRTDLYGIIISNTGPTSDKQNIVGNEVTNAGFLKGMYSIGGKSQFTYGNNIRGSIQPAGTTTLADNSYYLSQAPSFWSSNHNWPSVGINNAINSGSNPARDRYISGIYTSCASPLPDLKVIVKYDSIICNGGTTTVTVSASGGTPPYTGTGTYTLPAGPYNFTVKDVNGVAGKTIGVIRQPEVLKANAEVTPIKCYGDSSTITTFAEGGKSPYTGTGPFTAAAGVYNYIIRDANGCAAKVSAVVNQPDSLKITATYNPIAKYGDSTRVEVRAEGGKSPYRGTGIFTVAAGNYSYDVTDSNGCSKRISIVVNQPAPITVATSISPIACNGGKATIKATATGGSSDYLYSIDGVNFQKADTFLVSSGNYIISVMDASQGAGKSDTVTVIDPAPMTLAIEKSNISSCNLTAGGAITVSASGGTGTFQYKLNNGNYQSANSFNNLASGTYSVGVKDVNGCMAGNTGIVITKPSAVSFTVVKSVVSSCRTDDGRITVNAIGGVPPYRFTIDGVNYQTRNVFDGLSTGSYTVTVGDSKGCTKTISGISITKSAPVAALLVSKTNVSTCKGGADGLISIRAAGGVAPYTYSINGGTSQTSNTFENLPAGTYSFTLVDSKGCVSPGLSVSLVNALPLTISATKINVSACHDIDGSITARGTGGIAPYSYVLNGVSQTTAIFNNLPPAIDSAWIVDSKGCISNTATVKIEKAVALAVSASKANVSACNGGSDGSITVRATGGNSPYKYYLNGSPYQTSNIFKGLSAGTDTIMVEDARGCTSNPILVSIAAAAPLTVSVTKTNVTTCSGGNNGSITARPSGGISPYRYSIDGVTYQTSNVFPNLSAGTYNVTVLDSKGCTIASAPVTLTAPTNACSTTLARSIGVETLTGREFKISAFPNPSTTAFNIKIEGKDRESVQLRIVDVFGKLVYLTVTSADQVIRIGDHLSAGVYVVEARQGEKTQTIKIAKE